MRSRYCGFNAGLILRGDIYVKVGDGAPFNKSIIFHGGRALVYALSHHHTAVQCRTESEDRSLEYTPRKLGSHIAWPCQNIDITFQRRC